MEREGSAWFWRIFGGSVIGIITVLIIAIQNNLSNNIAQLQAEITKIKDDTKSMTASIAALDEFREITKEKNKYWENAVKEKEQQLMELRERTIKVEEKLKQP